MKEKHIVPVVNEEEADNGPERSALESAAHATDEKAEVNRWLNDGGTAKQLIAPGFSGKGGYQASCHCAIPRGGGRG